MSPKRKVGSQKCLIQAARKSKKHSTSKVSASQVESISNYFIKVKTSAQTETPQMTPMDTTDVSTEDKSAKLDSESPYKNLIKTNTKIILNDSINDAADFRSPVPANVQKKLTCNKAVQKSKTQVKKSNQSKRGRRKTSTKKSPAKILTDNFKYFGENAEHMQMAIALSKSSYEAECGSSSDVVSPKKEGLFDIGEILESSKPSFLERFGFTSRRKILSVENRKVPMEASKKNRNRFKYKPPILHIRSSEERDALIESKISVLLCQNNPRHKQPYEYTLYSDSLINCVSKHQSVFNSDNIYQKNFFYANGLDIPQHIYKSGCLFKDWNSIPGRDKSPCKIGKDDDIAEKKCNKDQDTELSMIEDVKESTSLENSTQINTINKNDPPYQKSPVKSNALSLDVNCSLSSTETQTTVLRSYSSESKDSACVNWAKSTVQSFSSSYRSMSPDLFGSDDEIDCQNPNRSAENVTEQSVAPKKNVEARHEHFLDISIAAEAGINNSFQNCSEEQENGLKYDAKIIERDLEPSGFPIEIIGLTDDDCGAGVDRSDNYLAITHSINPRLQNEAKHSSNTSKGNMYNLDDFEDDKVELNPENKYDFNHGTSYHNDEYFNDFTSENDNSGTIKSKYNAIGNNKGDQETLIAPSHDTEKFAEHGMISDSSSSDIELIEEDSDTLKNQSKQSSITTEENIYRLDDFENHNHSENELSPETKTLVNYMPNKDKDENVYDLRNETDDRHTAKSKNSDCIDIEHNRETLIASTIETESLTGDYGSSSSDIEIISDNETDFKNSYFNEPPKINTKDTSCTSNRSESRIKANINDTLMDDLNKQNMEDFNLHNSSRGKKSLSSVNSKSLNLEETSQRCLEGKGVESIESPCFDESIFHNSTDLNITGYVHEMLTQDRLSFDNVHHVDAGKLDEEGLQPINEDEDMSLSQGSQSSIILDDELNYSSYFATPGKNNGARNKKKYCSQDEIEILEDMVPLLPVPRNCLDASPPNDFPIVDPKIVLKVTATKQTSTPDNFIIKTHNVTPMPDYDGMATPVINKELQKVGVKPLKRIRAAKLLKYIYDSTHPFAENVVADNSESDDDKRIIKRRKKSNEDPSNLECNFSSMTSSSDRIYAPSIQIIGDRIIENEKLEDLIFERKQLAKIASCKVPLQIVWHNLVSSDQAIKENILTYEPLQLESLHIMLKEQGFKFHIQDLLTFLDKKCITIRTAQKQGMHR